MNKLSVTLHLCALVALLFMVTLFACYATEPRFSESAKALRDAGAIAGALCFAFFVVADVLTDAHARAQRVNTRNVRA